MKYLEDVYIVNADGLANELRNGTLSEARTLKHYIAAAIIAGFTVYFPVGLEYEGSEYSIFGNLTESFSIFLLFGIISYYGILASYQSNTKGDGSDFYLRVAVLTLPVLIRVWILALFVGVPILIGGALLYITFFDNAASSSFILFQYSVDAGFAIVFYLKLRKYMSIAAGSYE